MLQKRCDTVDEGLGLLDLGMVSRLGNELEAGAGDQGAVGPPVGRPHDPGKWAPDFNAMSDDELVVRARNWEALCLYGWHPYMYNPQLKRWLRRITRPTLVLWGASDGIVQPSYGRAYSASIPGARFELIAEAGHHPEVEQPEAFVDRVAAFLEQ